MREVAERAGVSIKTVSRVVNGESNVSAKVTRDVREAIQELDYKPNAAARALRTGASDTIGVLVDSFNDSFFSAMITVFEDRSLAVGFDIVVASSGRRLERSQTQLLRLLQRQLSGLLIAPVPGLDLAGIGLPSGLPVVCVDRRSDLCGYDAVLVQDRAGSKEAARHLIDQGHTRIAIIADAHRLSTIQDRLAGFREAHAEAGIAIDPAMVRADCPSVTDAGQWTRELLSAKPPPTAIFAASPLMGEGIISGLTAEAVHDVALVVFGDFPMADALTPAITVVDQNPVGIAHAAMDRLLDHVNGRDSYRADVVLPTRLIPRGSGEIPPRSRQ